MERNKKNKFRIGIVGAGPGGTFFALHLDKLTRDMTDRYEITLYDRKVFDRAGPRGCNMCAGAIGYLTYEKINTLNINFEDRIVRRIADGYVIHGKRREARITHPEKKGIYTVFRGGGPILDDNLRHRSFDQFLLDQCIEKGVNFVNKRVSNLRMVERGRGARYLMSLEDGSMEKFDFIVGAFGVNSPLSKSFIPGYVPPKTWHTCQAEIMVDPGYISEKLGNMIHIFSTDDKRMRFIAITPKDEYLTISAIGEHVKIRYLRDELEGNSRLREFLPPDYSIICHCHPQTPVGCAAWPFGDSVAVVGDAFVSRFLKNGIESAYETSRFLADTLVNYGTDGTSLENHFYKRCLNRYHRDNFWGKILFELYEKILRKGLLSDIYIRSVMGEGEDASKESAKLTRILWGVFAGDQPYREIVNEACSRGTIKSLIKHSMLK